MDARNRIAIRPLTADNAERFWALRLRGLRGHPEAFGRSFEEERATALAKVRPRIASPPDGFLLGAWRSDHLVGLVGVRRGAPKKQRHKVTFWGVYVASDVRGAGVARRRIAGRIKRRRALHELE